MSAFFPVFGMHPSGVGGGQTLERAGICPPPVRGSMPAFFPVVGLYPSGVGGGQTRTRSGEGGSVPFGRLGGPGVGFGYRNPN
jgi:hypothetical protein